MKSSSRQKIDYSRFAEGLIERGLIDRETMNHVLQQCQATGSLMPEVLVHENLVSDWEVSRVSCELYHLPFLTVDLYPPGAAAREGLDVNYLRQYCLVPLDRFGSLLTVCIPGIVPSQILEGLSTAEGVNILPVVGSVSSNRQWLEKNMPEEGMAPVDLTAALADDADWANIFDEGDAAVQLGLQEDDTGFSLDLDAAPAAMPDGGASSPQAAAAPGGEASPAAADEAASPAPPTPRPSLPAPPADAGSGLELKEDFLSELDSGFLGQE